jgi:hypothetical protein
MSQKPRTQYHDRMISMLKAVSSQTMYISAPRPFFELTHDLVLAAMIAQLVYWCDRATRSDGFVFKSARDWYDEVGATRYAVQKFKKLPFVFTKIVRANGSPTTHYRIDMDKLAQALLGNDPFFDPDPKDREPEMGRSDVRNEPVDELNSHNGVSESRGSTFRNETNHHPISDEPPSENEQTLTDITTDTTTDNTTFKREPPEFLIYSELADWELEKAEQKKETPPIGAEKADRSKEREEFRQFTNALADITGYDISLKKTSSRVLVAARQLVQAGYTLADLNHFLPYWKEIDWRWKKNNQLPTPEDVLLNICRARNHKNRFRRWFG